MDPGIFIDDWCEVPFERRVGPSVIGRDYYKIPDDVRTLNDVPKNLAKARKRLKGAEIILVPSNAVVLTRNEVRVLERALKRVKGAEMLPAGFHGIL